MGTLEFRPPRSDGTKEMNADRFWRAIELRDSGKLEDALQEFETLADLESDAHEKADLFANQANCLWRLGGESAR
jgi:hypothetical protein